MSAEVKGFDLRKARQGMRLTQARLAVVLGVAKNTIARLERGELPITENRARHIALAFGEMARTQRVQAALDSIKRVRVTVKTWTTAGRSVRKLDTNNAADQQHVAAVLNAIHDSLEREQGVRP